MKKLNILAFALTFMWLALWIIYAINGQYVDETGLLVEEFWALALGWFCLILAIGLWVTRLFLYALKWFKRSKLM